MFNNKYCLRLLLGWCCLWPAFGVALNHPPIQIVAAENFYGELAKKIGGQRVTVTSILKQPDQDPHFFNMGPKLARKIVDAELVIYNGLGYDAWMIPLLSTRSMPTRSVIIVADLLNKKAGDNPHIWYDPKAMLHYAKALLAYFIQRDPQYSTEYQARFQQFQKQYAALTKIIERIRNRHQHTAIIAAESVFGEMARCLKLSMLSEDFQKQMINGNEPSLRQVKAFENALRQRQAKVLIHNLQVVNPLTSRMIHIAQQHKIPIVSVTEIQPTGLSYIRWMLTQLQQLEKALDDSFLTATQNLPVL